MNSTTTKIGGVPRGALPWWIHTQPLKEKTLLLVPDDEDVLDIVDEIKSYFRLPKEWGAKSPFDVRGYTVDDEPGRQVALHHFLFQKTKVLVASTEGLSLACDTKEDLKAKTLFLKPGSLIKRKELENSFARGSYGRTDRVENVGEYVIRGDVIDIWPPGEAMPLRLTWNMDTLEAIREIDIYSQRSGPYRTELYLFPVMSGDGATLEKLVQDAAIIDPKQNQSSEGFESPPLFSGHIDRLKAQLINWHNDGWRVVIYCHNQGECDRLEELLEERLLSAQGKQPPWLPPLIIGELEHGFIHPGLNQAVLANSEIFGRYRKRIRLPKFEGGQALTTPMDIKPNDFLVHEKHGIGRFTGLQSLKIDKVRSEFLSLEYKGGDKLYVPIFELQQVQKYMGAEGRRPALSSLDTATWERLKKKVKEDVTKLAKRLLEQAAKRNVRPGYAFAGQSHLEEEFANSFLYELTTDQKRTWEEVESDMVSTKAMDRLVCGDVGYGKTEIAMRAALKSALSAKQVCLLCPTTILAEQHYRNMRERMMDYPVTVALLSRFQSKAEQKKILTGVASGGIDIIIGTHRLLSKDVAFKNLGLLIIDEEHRFGVRQKNKLLDLKETVDVLSLTATPIPRTLASSLGGIKNLSIIETPPAGRLPISTHVGLFDEDLMAKAVQEELDRGGQVFYVHNRVKTLQARKEWLESLLPSIRIGMAHGQMKEDDLEKAMHDFVHKKIDLLLATTIIESGLDIPSVNTLVVEEAEEMGLSQLYQLRGRVGRSKRKAYCYLFYSTVGMTQEAKKRLEALKEFTGLGSGFRLAMRDMEIRGAGNLLGPEQHGNMAAVGLETFSKLLHEEIGRIKGDESAKDDQGPLMELSVSSYLPDDYVPIESERIQLYKRVLNADKDQLDKIKEELNERFGSMPGPAKLLFDLASLRLLLKYRGVSEVHQEDASVLFYFRPDMKLGDDSFNKIIKQPDLFSLVPGNPPGVRIKMTDGDNVLDSLGKFMRIVFEK